MGLAKLREGDVEAGRMEMEIAAGLDPMNALIRSYLGKAYFEEKRYNLAEAQFDLAKALDPNDPTPWFYDAIQKQTQNRPVQALRPHHRSSSSSVRPPRVGAVIKVANPLVSVMHPGCERDRRRADACG